MPVDVVLVDTAADTDVLSGTDLDPMPGPGFLRVWMASTVATATVTASMPEQNFTRAAKLVLRSGGVPDNDRDTPVVITPTAAGEKLTINLGGTTGTCYTHARWLSPAELSSGIT